MIGAQCLGPGDVRSRTHDRHEPGPCRPAPDRGQDAPAVEGLPAQIDDDGVEPLLLQEGDGCFPVRGRDLLDAVELEPSFHDQDTRSHRAPPP